MSEERNTEELEAIKETLKGWVLPHQLRLRAFCRSSQFVVWRGSMFATPFKGHTHSLRPLLVRARKMQI
jgi:hypothetical protein